MTSENQPTHFTVDESEEATTPSVERSPLDESSSSERGEIERPDSEAPADSLNRAHHTRISSAWVAVAVAVVLGAALIDFILENTRSVRIDFFNASGHIPVAVALLASAVSGAAVVLAVGVCRTAQLRLSMRRHQRAGKAR